MKQTTKAQVLAPLLLLAIAPLFVGNLSGCKKDEPPPPLPSAAPAVAPPPPAPTQPIELVPEVAPAPSASASATATKTGGGAGGSLKNCCSALTQNAQSAPEPNKTYMLQAAAVCNGLAAAGQASGAALGPISAALKGAGMPTACK